MDGAARPPYWLIMRQENGRMDLLTVGLASGEKVLPIFSFEEEAEIFLRLEAPGVGWWVRETIAGELVSVLLGPCASAKRVALDPLPTNVGGEAMVELVSLGRETFLRSLVGKHKFSTPPWLSSRKSGTGQRSRVLGAEFARTNSESCSRSQEVCSGG